MTRAAPGRPTQAVILAGGRGTRLAPITTEIPKGLVPFAGEPFNGHIVRMLAEQGFADVLFLLGYLHEQYEEHFGNGSDYGVRIRHRVTHPDDLTVHRVRDAWDDIDDTFLLLYCDNYWPMDFDRQWAHHVSTGAPCSITVYSNEDGWTRDSVIVEDGMCRVFDRTRTTPGLQGVEIGYAILDKAAVGGYLPDTGDDLFEQAIYPPLAHAGRLGAYWTRHRYMSVGGHERLPITRAFFEGPPTVLLDRDGTIIERPPQATYVSSPDEVRFLPGAREALAELASAGWRVLVLSNQAGIERGILSESDVEAVNAHVAAEVAATGGRIDGFYVCPHHWDTGCDCRKPEPGMLFQAQREHHFDLTRSFYLGDDERDGYAAYAARARFAMVDEDRPLSVRVEALLAGTLEDEPHPALAGGRP